MKNSFRYHNGFLRDIKYSSDGLKKTISFLPLMGQEHVKVILNQCHLEYLVEDSDWDNSLNNITLKFLYDFLKYFEMGKKKAKKDEIARYTMTKKMLHSFIDGKECQEQVDVMTITFYNAILYLQKMGYLSFNDIKKGVDIVNLDEAKKKEKARINKMEQESFLLKMEVQDKRRKLAKAVSTKHFAADKIMLLGLIERIAIKKKEIPHYSIKALLESLAIPDPKNANRTISTGKIFELLRTYKKYWYEMHPGLKKSGSTTSGEFALKVKENEVNKLIKKRMKDGK